MPDLPPLPLAGVRFPAPKLERTPAQYVTAYMTGLGIPPPAAVWSAGRGVLGLEERAAGQ